MRRSALLLAILLVACGDDHEPAVDAAPDGVGACAPTPPAKPTTGPLADPELIDLGADCVPGGLRDLPGRWWLRAREYTVAEEFEFGYPKFEGDCTTGFRRANWNAEDADTSDGFSFQTWSDGTRFYNRGYSRFDSPQGTFESAEVFAACITADGSLAATKIQARNEGPSATVMLKGTPFSPAEPEVAKGLTLVGELAGTPLPQYAHLEGLDIAVDGNYAYIAAIQGLQVVDIHDPAHPTHVKFLPGSLNDVTLYRSANAVTAYGAPFNGQRTTIYNVTDPTMTTQLGTIDAYSHTIEITPNTTPPKMYFGDYTDHVPIYDISTPTSPVLIASVPFPGGSGQEHGIHDTFIDGNRIWANKTYDGVYAVDVSSGTSTPTLLGHVPTSYSHNTYSAVVNGKKIAIHGDEGMSPEGGAFMRVIDAEESSPTFMQVIGKFQTRPEVGIHNMFIRDNKAYVAYYQDGVRVIDLSDPTHPTEVAHYNTFNNDTAPGEDFEGVVGIAVVGEYIYLADDLRNLIILHIDP